MKITYDKYSDAMYLYLKKGKYFKSVKVNDDFLIDIDKRKNIIGIELLWASKQVSQEFIDSSIQIGENPVSHGVFLKSNKKVKSHK